MKKKLPAWQENNNNIEKLKRTSIINDDIVWPGKMNKKPKKSDFCRRLVIRGREQEIKGS